MKFFNIFKKKRRKENSTEIIPISGGNGLTADTPVIVNCASMSMAKHLADSYITEQIGEGWERSIEMSVQSPIDPGTILRAICVKKHTGEEFKFFFDFSKPVTNFQKISGLDTELEKSFKKIEDLHLAQHISETLKGLGSPDVKIWDKDDYFNFYRNEGVRILTKRSAITPEQAGKIYDQKFEEVCKKYSNKGIDIDDLFRKKMELQKVLYPEEFILLGGIEDVKGSF